MTMFVLPIQLYMFPFHRVLSMELIIFNDCPIVRLCGTCKKELEGPGNQSKVLGE